MKTASGKKPAKKKENRGGPRPGAGRKPRAANSKKAAKSKTRERRGVTAGKTALAQTAQTNLARKYGKLAIEALADVAVNALSENARVQAAERLLQWGYGKPLGIGDETLRPKEGGAKKPALGKKEQQLEAAKNPDTTTAMGDLMAQRQEQARKLNS